MIWTTFGAKPARRRSAAARRETVAFDRNAEGVTLVALRRPSPEHPCRSTSVVEPFLVQSASSLYDMNYALHELLRTWSGPLFAARAGVGPRQIGRLHA